jgi:dihydrofolate synthase/folylpolyglutamate synthase
MNYKEALRYLDSFIDYEKIIDYPYNSSLNLRRMERLCQFFDNPHKRFKSVHIGGTKGKGSVAAILASILREGGLKVGLYTSPHLISPRERIRILKKTQNPKSQIQKEILDLEGMISEEEITSLIEEIKPALEEIQQDESLGKVSFFELYTILAFLYFAQQQVDIAVLEVGMGGRLDATNVVRPLVAVFTPISLDHTDKLGPDLTNIAGEKAEIIKKGCLVVSSPQDREAGEIIRNVCRQKGVPLYQVDGQIDEKCAGLRFSLKGRYQRVNLALALRIVEVLKRYDIEISSDSIRAGLERVIWPGRLEVIGEFPLLVIDGAQNRASARALKESIKDFSFSNLILVLGISANKDITGVVGELCPEASQVILTKAANPRAAEPEAFEERVKEHCQNITLTRSIEEALAIAKQIASKDDLILITGSLYLVGEVLKINPKSGFRI